MATFDISRMAFDPKKHYTSVRMQQGRVLTDDDWNENERIENEERRRSNVDVIGAYGSPDDGFRIRDLSVTDPIDFKILPGTLYLGGLRLDMDSLETFCSQKDWLQQPNQPKPCKPTKEKLADGKEQYDLVYIEAWQQPVSAVEDASLIEAALGGPDTTTRIRNMRRVKIQQNIGSAVCANAWDNLKKLLGGVDDKHERVPRVHLRATTVASGKTTREQDDLCAVSTNTGYLGAENQTIRVQLLDDKHFSWGFDNVAPIYRAKVAADGKTIRMITQPKDQYHWPLSGQIVEVLPWSAVLSNQEKIAALKGHFSKVTTSYDPDANTDNDEYAGEFTLENPVSANFLGNTERSCFVRIWRRDTTEEPKKIPFGSEPVNLGKTGIAVTINIENGYQLDDDFCDFWVISVRPETPDVIVPWELKAVPGMPPMGIRRFYAPLALIRWVNTGGKISGEIIQDCRKIFRPLTNLESCCTFTVGDGVNSHGDFNSIEEAVHNLPPYGGKICVLPGEHTANVFVSKRQQIHFSGCGGRTIIRPKPRSRTLPIFQIAHAQNIRIDHLTLIAPFSSAIIIEDVDVKEKPSQEISIQNNRITAGVHAIKIHVQEDLAGDNGFRILDNYLTILDKEDAQAAIFSIADDVLIQGNRIMVIALPDPQDLSDLRKANDFTTTLLDPCADPQDLYKAGLVTWKAIDQVFEYVEAYVPSGRPTTYKALGGIQIGGTSERVRIIQNEIIGGKGNGISLGHLPEISSNNLADNPNLLKPNQPKSLILASWGSATIVKEIVQKFNNFLYEITIADNKITSMGHSGIGVFAFLQVETIRLSVSVENLNIHGNTITKCAQQIPGSSEIPYGMLDEVAFGGIVLTDCVNVSIQKNCIEENGKSHREPICGIFIFNGEQIDVSNNKIINNGPRLGNLVEEVRKGNRGGIVIRSRSFSLNLDIEVEQVIAVKICDNIVVQPIGHALFLRVMGAVSIVNNHFISQGICTYSSANENPYDMLEFISTVFVLNTGLSKDAFVLLLLGFLNLRQMSVMFNTAMTTPKITDSFSWLIFKALQCMPSGKTLFTGNQTMLDLRTEDKSEALCSQVMLSLDDIGYSSNQSECASLFEIDPVTFNPITFDMVNLDTLLLGFSVRANDNRFTEGSTMTAFSLAACGVMTTVIGNQSTHCLLAHGLKESVAANSVLFDINNCSNLNQLFGQKMIIQYDGE